MRLLCSGIIVIGRGVGQYYALASIQGYISPYKKLTRFGQLILYLVTVLYLSRVYISMNQWQT